MMKDELCISRWRCGGGCLNEGRHLMLRCLPVRGGMACTVLRCKQRSQALDTGP